MTLTFRCSAASDVGLLRKENQDSAYAGAHLAAVADGVSGNVHGEIASAVAISTIAALDRSLPSEGVVATLHTTVDRAGETLRTMTDQDAALQGMGTTLTALLCAGSDLYLVHIGDSRAYLLRAGELTQVSKDHTLVQSLLDDGHITAKQAAVHPQRSLILRALDGRAEMVPDVLTHDARPGDRWLLCSDGLSDYADVDAIRDTLDGGDDIDRIAADLIALANRGGGGDNITCAIADIAAADTPHRQPVAVGAVRSVPVPVPWQGPDTPAVPEPPAPADTAPGIENVREPG